MKKLTVLSVLFLLLLPGLHACDAYTTPSNTSTAPIADTTDAAALRAYYEKLVADLRDELLNEKQADYVTRASLENRISELESLLEALQSSEPEADPSPSTEAQVTTAVPSPPTTAFQYVADSRGITIEAYAGTAREIQIPPSITGIPVTRIDDHAFQGTIATSVILPDTVSSIGWFAFADCRSLLTVTIPASVTSIEYGAFNACPNITILCPKNSYAAAYAESFGLRTVYVSQ